MFSFAARRVDADACPGALRLHTAADGPLARVRLPGGRLTGAQLRALRELAEDFGDGQAELTSRANLQLRALTGTTVETLAARLRAASLLPSDTHEIVRNIVASPLADCTAPLPVDLAQLDRELCADPRLATLPGRFLFAVDNGTFDMTAQADVAAVPAPALPAPALPAPALPAPALPAGRPGPETSFPSATPLSADRSGEAGAGSEVAILVGGLDAGLRVPAEDAVIALLTVAHAFLDERGDGTAWRIRELPDGPRRVAARAASALGVTLGAGGAVPQARRRELVGSIGQAAGLVAMGAIVPLGRLSGVQMKVLEEAQAVIVTPWRGVLLPGLTPQAAREWAGALAAAGLEVHSGSRWAGVTTCAGRPGCARALADVRGDASAATLAPGSVRQSEVAGGLPVHWVGCPRGCGSPAGAHVRVEATGAGYTVSGPGSSGFATDVEVGDLVAAARRS